ncbi:lipoma-preferred partner homolog [Anopheles albimanus]|uniref:LIM zinc-binding domain-containing protein n=1 Tax=Anopheles albimanus TaxID=7167 RepID=A0A182F561_ANOAL|nr:lipoma-preferred partner homolog [Anopheles albimanus]XP_035772605.1 lipoma-preferred partner homolog [Anopheles albimanus]
MDAGLSEQLSQLTKQSRAANGAAALEQQQQQQQPRPYHSTGLPDCPPNGAGIPGTVMVGKKSGPAVPPKPRKGSQQQVPPQVPKSSNVKQYCEPSFSTVLQGQSNALLDEHAYTNVVGNGATAATRPTAAASPIPGGLVGKMGVRKVTLDNALELQQQKEALEHHKRVLEDKLKHASSAQATSGTVYENAQQAAYVSGGYGSDATYSNLPPGGAAAARGGAAKGAISNDGLIYSNILHSSSNVPSKPFPQRQVSEELPPPPPQDMQQGIPLTLNALSLEDNDEEFPPPPSPVSSSYSELRRATDPPVGHHHHHHLGRQAQPTYNMVGPGAVGPPGGAQSTYSNLGPGSQIYANNMPHHHHHLHQHQQSLYGTYGGMSSQGSTTYESIYEPINPRPPSQMSGRSNYSLYAPYVNSHGINSSNDSIITSASQQQPQSHHLGHHHRGGVPKETEVDTLTDLLVQSMDGTQDVDSYGTCVKCGERVVGENTGCTAMDKIYHITCFTCQQCQINLQGKPFYSLDGKPYCEEDYLNTLEKCSVCLKPILERILRATGKPYHPQCFTCIVCGKSLDGIPFTVDATNQIHCIEDFHKKFAPRCCVCKHPIMPEPGQDETVRVVALDRSFHINCYKCEDCGLLLSSEAEGRGCYPLDDHILCKSCNAKRVQALTSHMTTEL